MIDNKTIHDESLRLLDEVDKILTGNNIWFSLSYGCVLGAVREKGFIPWDRDIDIVIKKPDQKHVYELLKKNLSSKYRYLSCKQDTVAAFDTVTIDGIPENMMHMDIYPLVGGPMDPAERHKYQKKTRFYHRLASCKYADMLRLQKKWKSPVLLAVKGVEHLIPDAVFRNAIEKMTNQYSFNESKYLVPMGNDGKDSEFMERSLWLDVRRVPFETLSLPIPSNTHEYLVNLYGKDYMTPKKY